MSIDSENLLFDRLKDYYAEMPNLISRRQYNDRRKFTGELCEKIRKRIADKMDGAEEYFCRVRGQVTRNYRCIIRWGRG